MRKWANRPSSRWKWLFAQWEGTNQFSSAPISDFFFFMAPHKWKARPKIAAHADSQRWKWWPWWQEFGGMMPPKNIHETFIWLLNRISADDLLLWKTEMGWGWSASCAVERCRMDAGHLWEPPVSDYKEVLGPEPRRQNAMWHSVGHTLCHWHFLVCFFKHTLDEGSLKFLSGQDFTFTSTLYIHFTQAIVHCCWVMIAPSQLILKSKQLFLYCQGMPELAPLRYHLLVLHWTQWPQHCFTVDQLLTDWNRANRMGKSYHFIENNELRAMQKESRIPLQAYVCVRETT